MVTHIPLEKHSLPAVTILYHITDLPASFTTSLPVTLVMYKISCDMQRQTLGDLIQYFSLVLWQ